MICDSIQNQPRWIPYNLIPTTNKKPQKVPAVKWQDPNNRKPFSELGKQKGIVFDPLYDSLVGLDLDDCIDANGLMNELAFAAIELFAGKAYIEKSVSGTGLHFLFYAKVGVSFNAKPIEYYEKGRYFTFSGNALPESVSKPLECTAEITQFLERYAPDQLNKKGKPEADHEPSLTSVEDIRDALKHISPDGSRGEWFDVACSLHDDFGGADTGFVLFHDWSQTGDKYVSEQDCLLVWNSLGRYDGPKKGIGSLFLKAKEGGWVKKVAPTPPKPVSGGGGGFIRNDDGIIIANQSNFFKVLPEFQIRLDTFKDRVMGVFDGKVRPIEDTDFTRIQYHCERLGFGRGLSTAMIRENVLFYASEHSFDSAIEWAETLVWDGVKRCENLLHLYFGAEDTLYTRAVSAYMTTGMAARLISPGHQVDSAVVLYGAQGTGKTSSAKAIAPEGTFGEVDLNPRNVDDRSRGLKGKLICELAELKGLKSSNSEAIKAFISKTHEEFTDKWQSLPHVFPRRCFFIGTTNDREFLSDGTGNRRWLPVAVGPADSVAIAKDRDLIWAEAIQWFKRSGVQWKQASELVKEIHEEFTNMDPLVEDIREYFAKHPDITKIPAKHLYTEVSGFEFDQKAGGRLKRAMEFVEGWERKVLRDGKKTYRGYEKLGDL